MNKINTKKGYNWLHANLPKLYDKKLNSIKIYPKTKEMVKNIILDIHRRLDDNYLVHHGVKGQKRGVRNGPPYPIDRSKRDGLKNTVGKSIIKSDKASINGEPNSIIQVENKNGGINRNYYDDSGRLSKQISNNNHGNSKHHDYGKNGEHAHDFIYNEYGEIVSRPIRELTDEERKENGDIL